MVQCIFFKYTVEKPETWSFLLALLHCAREDCDEQTSGIFLPVLMHLVSHSLSVQVPLNQILDFSQRELVCVLLFSWHIQGGMRIWDFLFH